MSTVPIQQENPLDGMPRPRCWYSMIITALGTCMAVLDSTIVNAALPAFTRAFAIDPSQAIWIVNAFQLALVATLLPFSALGNVITHRRVFQGGLWVFTIASLGCALSQNLNELLAARIVAGIGAGAILSLGPAMYRLIFPAQLLGTGLGISSSMIALSSALGPALGGWILSVTTWQWIFAVNIPVGLGTSLLALWLLPKSEPSVTRIDFVSVITSAGGLVLTILGIDFISRGVSLWPSLAIFALGLISIVSFMRRQSTLAYPLIELSLFKNPYFRLATWTSCIVFFTVGLALIPLPFFLNAHAITDLRQLGLLLSIWPLATAVVGHQAGRLADRFPPRHLSSIGLGLYTLGLLCLGTLSRGHAVFLDIAWRSALCGAGFGLFQPANNRELMSGASRAQIGNTSGILATVRVLGQTLGAVAAGALLAALSIDQGSRSAFCIGALLLIVTICLSLFQRVAVKQK